MSPITLNLSAWRRIAELIAGDDDPAIATKAGQILMWADLGGDNDRLTLDVASGLHPGWRSAARQEERERLLTLIIDNFPGLSGWPLTHAITEAVEEYQPEFVPNRDAGRRPPALKGLIHDLLLLGNFPKPEWLRKVLDQIRFLRGVAATQSAPRYSQNENFSPSKPAAGKRRVRTA